MPEDYTNAAIIAATLLFLIGFPLFFILYLSARKRAKNLAKDLEQEKDRGVR